MPEYALWTLVITFAALAFGIAVKSATTSHRLQMAGKELNALITQIKSTGTRKRVRLFKIVRQSKECNHKSS